MKKHEFYGWYANIPLGTRPIVIPHPDREVSPDNCYRKIKENDHKIAQLVAEQEEWLAIADLIIKYWKP